VADAVEQDGQINERQRRVDCHGDHAAYAESRDKRGDTVGFAAAQRSETEPQNYGRADANEADEAKVKRCRQLLVADGDEVAITWVLIKNKAVPRARWPMVIHQKGRSVPLLRASNPAEARVLPSVGQDSPLVARRHIGKLSDVLGSAPLEQRVCRHQNEQQPDFQ